MESERGRSDSAGWQFKATGGRSHGDLVQRGGAGSEGDRRWTTTGRIEVRIGKMVARQENKTTRRQAGSIETKVAGNIKLGLFNFDFGGRVWTEASSIGQCIAAVLLRRRSCVLHDPGREQKCNNHQQHRAHVHSGSLAQRPLVSRWNLWLH